MQAIYYDGQTARAHEVTLSLESGSLVIAAAVELRRAPLADVNFMEAIGDAPRVIRLAGGGSCEILDLDGYRGWLAANGAQESRVSSWERSRRMVLAAVIFLLAGGFVAYQYVLPAMANVAAERLPDSSLDTLSEQIQVVLDRTFFATTALPDSRVSSIRAAFAALALPADERERWMVHFRRSDVLGANAMALPNGQMFVTDALVELLPDDRAVIAVLAHEAGHVHLRHGLRQIIQSTVLGALITIYLGDVSALGAAAPTALLQAKYSRDLEREADAYAADVLARSGLPVSLLVDALGALEASQGGSGASNPLTYLSSHPATAERIAWLNVRHQRR